MLNSSGTGGLLLCSGVPTMCQWPVSCQQYKGLGEATAPPTTLMPGPWVLCFVESTHLTVIPAGLCQKWGRLINFLRQTGKWVRRAEIYPGSLVVTDTQSPGLKSFKEARNGTNYTHGAAWVIGTDTDHQALTGSPTINFQYGGFLWCSFILQSLLLLGASRLNRAHQE